MAPQARRLTHTVLAAAALMTATSVVAADRNQGSQTITARSKYGYGTVQGLTRPGKFGLEVRLPSGSWVSCAGDCRETLVNETVDFWLDRDLNHPHHP